MPVNLKPPDPKSLLPVKGVSLGVTEAGDGDYARIKSTLGIGTLLAEGIGDTIRVSLTEPPLCELPVCYDILQGLCDEDRLEPERLAGVDREVEVLAPNELEGVQVSRGRVAGLGAGDVEPAHAAVAPAHRELGDLHRAGGRLPDGAQQKAHRDVPAFCSPAEAGQRGLYDLVEGHPRLEVQLRREAHLGVDHAVGSEVLDALGGDPLECLGS